MDIHLLLYAFHLGREGTRERHSQNSGEVYTYGTDIRTNAIAEVAKEAGGGEQHRLTETRANTISAVSLIVDVAKSITLKNVTAALKNSDKMSTLKADNKVMTEKLSELTKGTKTSSANNIGSRPSYKSSNNPDFGY
jgi:hypothetical protein